MDEDDGECGEGSLIEDRVFRLERELEGMEGTLRFLFWRLQVVSRAQLLAELAGRAALTKEAATLINVTWEMSKAGAQAMQEPQDEALLKTFGARSPEIIAESVFYAMVRAMALMEDLPGAERFRTAPDNT